MEASAPVHPRIEPEPPEWQPRALWVGAPAGNNVWGAIVWCLVIIAVFAPLAVARYRRAASD